MTHEPSWSIDGVSTRPGVYLFKDEAGKVLYVGKARNLRSRLSSYRRPGGDGRLAVHFLELEARSVETILTRTESEALLLEDTLIKQHKPPHNVRLKDDKSFLMVRIDEGEDFPRPKFVRAHRPRHGKESGVGRSRLFGPFASARSVRRTLSDLHRVVPLRDCTDAVMNNRTRPCLKHQIGLCAAPCVGYIEKDAYRASSKRICRGVWTSLPSGWSTSSPGSGAIALQRFGVPSSDKVFARVTKSSATCSAWRARDRQR